MRHSLGQTNMASQKPADIATVAQDRLKILLARVPRFSIAHNTYRSITFTCFPRLPAELRQKVWGYAACHERIIKLNYKFPSNQDWKFGIEDNKVEDSQRLLQFLQFALNRERRLCDSIPWFLSPMYVYYTYTRFNSQCHILIFLLALPENSNIHLRCRRKNT